MKLKLILFLLLCGLVLFTTSCIIVPDEPGEQHHEWHHGDWR